MHSIPKTPSTLMRRSIRKPRRTNVRWPGLLLAALLGAPVAMLAQSAEEQEQMARMLANRHAKRICSGVFLSGREAGAVVTQDHDTPTSLVDVQVNRVAGTVAVSSMGGEGMAVYRPGLGCTIAVDLSPDQLAAQANGVPLPKPLDSEVPFPLGSKVEIATPAGVDRAKLDAALDKAFSEPNPDLRRGSRGAIVVYDGEVVGERYAEGFGPDKPLIIWSMSKSLTSAWIGLLARDGKLDPMGPAPVPEWATEGDPRGAITIDQLLRMSSGLKFQEVYEAGLIDVAVMLFGESDMAHFAAAQPLEAEPDGKWSYSSGTTNILARIAKDALGGEIAPALSYLRSELLDRIGMHQTVLELDESGTAVGSSYGYSTPRDLARFGLLYLQKGLWNGERVLPEEWVEYSVTPTPLAPRQQYGAQFWLNAGDPDDPTKRRFPSVPTDAFWLSGFEGQSVVVVPSRKAVIVRLGRTIGDGAFDLDEFLADVLSALPE